MDRVGPPLETLLRRLAETPPDFMDEPRMGDAGRVHVPALVNDLLLRHGARAPQAKLASFESRDPRATRNFLALVMIAVWLLADDWFVRNAIEQSRLLRLLSEELRDLAEAMPAHRFTSDPERREELARLMLARLGYRPEAETQAQAQDRLAHVNSGERKRLLAASREAERRARAIREALAKKAAEESADKWTRE